jgi:hypothetical protein
MMGRMINQKADINMVVLVPKEFMSLADSDVFNEELGMAQLTLEPTQAIFEKPEDEKRQHLKALFLKGFVNGKPVTKMLVDGGVAVNLMSYTMLRKIGKSDEDLTQTDMMLVDFKGNVSPTQGAMELTIGSKTFPTTLLSLRGRDLIIYYWDGIGYMQIVACHLQCIIQWIRDPVEMVKGETSLTVAATEAQGWCYNRVSCTSRKAWDTDYLKMSHFGLQLVQSSPLK